MNKLNVTVWNEYINELKNERTAAIYPDGIHGQIASFLSEEADLNVRTAHLEQPDHGLGGDILDNTDVLLWWGHTGHNLVADAIVEKIKQRVLDGMGLIALHSSHYSKIFRSLMGTTCSLIWREIAEKERIWVVEPGHPIAEGLPVSFVIPEVEMYGERFDIPAPDTLVFISWFDGGEVFRSGCCYNRGKGKVFYFRPGYDTFPIYYQDEVKTILKNAVRWAAPTNGPEITYGQRDALEDI